MIYTWFYIFNLNEFNALGLGSKTYTVVLDGIGQRDILVTKGNSIGMVYEGVFLPLQLGKNPFQFDSYASYIDVNTNNVWLGLPDAD